MSDNRAARPHQAGADHAHQEERGGAWERPNDPPAWSSLLQRPMAFDSPARMLLTQGELNLAINIKTAIAANPEIHPVSDFMCAQLALIEGDNTDGAIGRLYQLQCYREEYGILDTAADGRKCFAEYMKLFPRLHLSFTFHADSGAYVMIYDNAQFDSSHMRSEEQLHNWLGGNYYTCAALCPDFESIRTGAVVVAECQGYVRCSLAAGDFCEHVIVHCLEPLLMIFYLHAQG